ncbi:hypothetical protein GQ53DRAFT_822433 [Thozetella sp. PMI_491]|nr:hypothetical protein GQ53DRAFT_822433 [Thozetella sp. PMI_491]
MNSDRLMEVIVVNPLVLHGALFGSKTYFLFKQSRSSSCYTSDPEIQFHLGKTLRLLQETLDKDDKEKLSDETLLTIIFLCITAISLGDGKLARHHAGGFARLVALRGGLKNLGPLRIQACRIDIGAAIATGLKPLFFREGLSWARSVDNKVVLAGDLGLEALLSYLDSRLTNVWADLRSVCQRAEKLHENSVRFKLEEYQELLASILYRLLHLDYKAKTPEESLRLAAATFASLLFLQHREHIFLFPRHISRRLQGAVAGFPSRYESKAPMRKLILWMHFVAALAYGADREAVQSLLPLLKAQIQELGLSSWEDTKAILVNLLWIDFMHDALGLYLYHEALRVDPS